MERPALESDVGWIIEREVAHTTRSPITAWLVDGLDDPQAVIQVLASWRVKNALTLGTAVVFDEARAIGGWGRPSQASRDARVRARQDLVDRSAQVAATMFPAGIPETCAQRMYRLTRATTSVRPPRPTHEIRLGIPGPHWPNDIARYRQLAGQPLLAIAWADDEEGLADAGFHRLAISRATRDTPQVASWIRD